MQLMFLGIVFACLPVIVDAATNVALGGDCKYAAEGRSNCADANAICTSQDIPKCVCKQTHEQSGTACIAKHTIGATCTSTDALKGDCLDNNAICPTTCKKCECKPGYTGTAGGSCAAKNEGSAPGQMSMWMLCMTIMTMSLAAYVV